MAVEVLHLERERLAAVLGKPGRGLAEHVLAEAVFVAEEDAGAGAEARGEPRAVFRVRGCGCGGCGAVVGLGGGCGPGGGWWRAPGGWRRWWGRGVG